jgi:hypothetical protein
MVLNTYLMLSFSIMMKTLITNTIPSRVALGVGGIEPLI